MEKKQFIRQQNGGWGNQGWPQQNGGWGNQGWPQQYGGWGNQIWPQQYGGWGNQGWPQQNSGWGNQAWPQQNGGWGNQPWLQQNSGWGSQQWPQQNTSDHKPAISKALDRAKTAISNKAPKTAPAVSSHPSQEAGSTAKVVLTPDQFTASDLTQDDLESVITKYGIDIEDIFSLAPGQEWMFGKARKVTNAFFLQTYFRINMKLRPAEFRQKLDEVSLRRPNLRTAFAYRDMNKVYQVVLKNRRPELMFIDLSGCSTEETEEIIELFRYNDRKRGFDLENDPLIRLAVFSTSEEDTYYVVMSQPHINDDGVSEGLLMKEIFIDYALDGKIPVPDMTGGSYQDYAKWIESIDKDAELDYWDKLLKGSRFTRLPGRVDTKLEPVMNTQILSFSHEEKELIPGMQSRYRATMNSIVQTAWGVMLQKIYKRNDAVFGSITSGRSAEVSGNDRMTGSFINAFPVRVKADGNRLFGDLVREIQSQILTSQNNAHCTPDEIEGKLGIDRPVFDHLLNFHNFGGIRTKGAPALPGISILGKDYFDNLSTGFCLYFQMNGKELICKFTYDSRSFSNRKIRVLMDCYHTVMQQIISDRESILKVEDIECPDLTGFLDAEDDEAAETGRKASLFKEMPMFDGVDDSSLWRLAEKSMIRNYSEGEIIIRERALTEEFCIVDEGYAELYRTANSGWLNSLGTAGHGRILSGTGLFDDVRSFMGAVAFSEEVKIITISKTDMLQFIEKHPQVAINLMHDLYIQSDRYSKLWVNSD